MKKAPRTLALVALASLAFAVGYALPDFLVATAGDIQFQHQTADDPRYVLLRQIEAECPGIYVVDIEARDVGEGEERVQAVGVYLAFDRRVTRNLDATRDTKTGKSELDVFIEGAHAETIKLAAAQGYDLIGVGLLYVHRVDVMGGQAWQGDVIQFVLGRTGDMLHWARFDGCDRAAMYARAETGQLKVWSANPYQPMYHSRCLPRPRAEQPMLWDALEAAEATK